MSSPTPRPRSVTLGCIYGGLGGILATLTLIEALQGWGSLEMQEALESGLSQLGSDADVDGLLPMLRWVVMALLVGAIAATVFAFHAARGHQASRIGLTVLAALAGITFSFAGLAGLLPAIMAGLIIYLLWSAPARQWFAVVNGRTPMSLGAEPSVLAGPQGPPVAQPPAYDSAHHPNHPAPPLPVAPSSAVQHAVPPNASHSPPVRPRPVTQILMISGLGSLIGLFGSGLVLLALVAMRDEVVSQYSTSEMLQGQLDSAGLTAEQMVSIGTWLFASWAAVSLAGVVATAWAATARRSGWWALLIVSAATAAVAVIGLPVGLAWIIGAIIVIVKMFRPEVKTWFHRA